VIAGLTDTVYKHATAIGDALEREYPLEYRDSASYVPTGGADEIADTITYVVAQILQSWLNAGSERDVTMEELGPAITDHVRGWTPNAS
jgi:hypothetical protein